MGSIFKKQNKSWNRNSEALNVKSDFSHTFLLVVFALNAFGCVYNETVQSSQRQAMEQQSISEQILN